MAKHVKALLLHIGLPLKAVHGNFFLPIQTLHFPHVYVCVVSTVAIRMTCGGKCPGACLGFLIFLYSVHQVQLISRSFENEPIKTDVMQGVVAVIS